MSDPLASVIIPVEEGCDTLQQCLDAVMRQDFEKTEVIVVCDARAAGAADLPKGSEEVRVIKAQASSGGTHLINDGMRAARGHVKVLLQPCCVPAERNWLRRLVEPFDEETVGVVVSRCEGEPPPGMAQRLLEAVDVAEESEPALPHSGRPLVSRRCDAYRASLLADLGYFNERMPSPADAIDVSIRVADAGYSIVMSEGPGVTCAPAPGRRTLGDALRAALDYGRADAILDKVYDLHWLNAGLFAVTLFSLLLPVVAALTLPVAVVLGLGIFLWGWALSVRVPLAHFDFPIAPIQGAAYAAIILSVRGDWWPWLFGWTMHPAIIRQWCWVGATVGAYLLLLGLASVWGAGRACRRRGGIVYALPILFVAALWHLLSGVGYLHGALFGGQSGE